MCNACTVASKTYAKASHQANTIYNLEIQPFIHLYHMELFDEFNIAISAFYEKYRAAIEPYLDVYLKIKSNCKDLY